MVNLEKISRGGDVMDGEVDSDEEGKGEDDIYSRRLLSMVKMSKTWIDPNLISHFSTSNSPSPHLPTQRLAPY